MDRHRLYPGDAGISTCPVRTGKLCEVGKVKIAIAGAGMAGTYLYRLLTEAGGHDVVLYDDVKRTGCGARPCAWGVAPSTEYRRLVGRFLDPERYVRERSEKVLIDGVAVGSDLLMVDKPGLIRDMIGGAPVLRGRVDPGEYDLVVDATGVERAYLGPVEGDDLVAELHQYRVAADADLGTWFQTSTQGYGWCFPLGGSEFHIGYGNLPPHVGAGMDTVSQAIEGAAVRCTCQSRIRLSSPYHSQPIARDNIVGVGESIGTVGPLGGDGNLYAMQCSETLFRNIHDIPRYQEEVLRGFGWMRKERETLLRLIGGRRPSPGDVKVFLEHARRSGFTMGPLQALRLLGKVGGV